MRENEQLLLRNDVFAKPDDFVLSCDYFLTADQNVLKSNARQSSHINQ
jgi:hypothetical protein